MALRLYFDVHVWKAILDGCRMRGIEVLTAQEDQSREFDDDSLLQRATVLGRILFTFDADFLQLANLRQKSNKPFSGIVYAHEMKVDVRQCIDDLELISQAADPSELMNAVIYLPLKSQ